MHLGKKKQSKDTDRRYRLEAGALQLSVRTMYQRCMMRHVEVSWAEHGPIKSSLNGRSRLSLVAMLQINIGNLSHFNGSPSLAGAPQRRLKYLAEAELHSLPATTFLTLKYLLASIQFALMRAFNLDGRKSLLQKRFYASVLLREHT